MAENKADEVISELLDKELDKHLDTEEIHSDKPIKLASQEHIEKLQYDFELPIKDTDYDALIDKINALNLSKISNTELDELTDELFIKKSALHTMQITAKVFCSVLYGASGSVFYQFFCNELAEDTTAEGRFLTKTTEKLVNHYAKNLWPNDYKLHAKMREQKFATVFDLRGTPKSIQTDVAPYSDTDSLYVDFGAFFKSYGIDPAKVKSRKAAVDFIDFISKEALTPYFNNNLTRIMTNRNAENNHEFQLEMIGMRGFFLKKKKYMIAVLSADDVYIASKGKLKSRGVELAQRSSSKTVRSIITRVVGLLFSRDVPEIEFLALCNSITEKALNDVEEKPDSASDYMKISNIKSTYKEYVLNDRERIVLAPKISAMLRGVAAYNHFVYTNGLEQKLQYLGHGDRAYWYYTVNGDAFAIPDDIAYDPAIMPAIDVKKQLEKTIFNPLKRMAISYSSEALKNIGGRFTQTGFKL